MKTQSEQINETYMKLCKDAQEEYKQRLTEYCTFMKALENDMLFIQSMRQKRVDPKQYRKEIIKEVYEACHCEFNDDEELSSLQSKR